MLDPQDLSCASDDRPACDRCRAGQACRRCTPEAMEKAERRERLRSIPGSEPTVFDHACWARATKDGRTRSFFDVLKRIWTMTEPVGTYERCQTFREIHHLEDPDRAPTRDEATIRRLACAQSRDRAWQHLCLAVLRIAVPGADTEG
jgi:hypothetical protein